MRLSRVVVCLFAIQLGLERLASANEAEGREYAALATTRAAKGDHRGAIEALERAFDADSSTAYLLQLAEQYEALTTPAGDPRDVRLAIANYREALAGEEDADRIKLLENRILRLEARLTPGPGSSPAAAVSPAVPQLRPPEPVAIRFFSADSTEPYYVFVGGQYCTTPCTLPLSPGPHELTTTGGGRLKLTLDVPAAAGRVVLRPGAEQFLMPGIVLTVVGPLVAASMWSLAVVCGSSSTCALANVIGWPLFGASLMFTGIGLLGYWGGHQTDTAEVEVSSADLAPHLKFASLGVQPLKNGAATGVGFTF